MGRCLSSVDCGLFHCGHLPPLTADGFTGPVYATPETLRLAEIHAVIQEDQALRKPEPARQPGSRFRRDRR